MKGKESWESTANGKAKDSICYANGCKLLFLQCQLRKKGKKVSPETMLSEIDLVDSFFECLNFIRLVLIRIFSYTG